VIELLRAAGFQSAPDVTARAAIPTWPSDRPGIRLDWIFGTPDVQFFGFMVVSTTASDHLPLVVSVRA
jgi:endonuclease/exonuclease/phosphatase family metal-dependent hydrolase